MDGMLTQEEIDALTGGNNSDSSTQQASDISESLTDAERDAVGEIANINMGTAATTLSTLLNNKVTITTPRVSYVTLNELSACLLYTSSLVFQVTDAGTLDNTFTQYVPATDSGGVKVDFSSLTQYSSSVSYTHLDVYKRQEPVFG